MKINGKNKQQTITRKPNFEKNIIAHTIKQIQHNIEENIKYTRYIKHTRSKTTMKYYT